MNILPKSLDARKKPPPPPSWFVYVQRLADASCCVFLPGHKRSTSLPHLYMLALFSHHLHGILDHPGLGSVQHLGLFIMCGTFRAVATFADSDFLSGGSPWAHLHVVGMLRFLAKT